MVSVLFQLNKQSFVTAQSKVHVLKDKTVQRTFWKCSISKRYCFY